MKEDIGPMLGRAKLLTTYRRLLIMTTTWKVFEIAQLYKQVIFIRKKRKMDKNA